MKKKAKKFDPFKLTAKEADELAVEIGSKVREICDNAAEEINKILSKYKMKASLSINLEPNLKSSKDNLNK